MCPSPDSDKSLQAALAAVEAAVSRLELEPGSDMQGDLQGDLQRDLKRTVSAAPPVDGRRAQQQRSQQLTDYCDKAIAEIRALLERSKRQQNRRAQ